MPDRGVRVKFGSTNTSSFSPQIGDIVETTLNVGAATTKMQLGLRKCAV